MKFLTLILYVGKITLAMLFGGSSVRAGYEGRCSSPAHSLVLRRALLLVGRSRNSVFVRIVGENTFAAAAGELCL